MRALKLKDKKAWHVAEHLLKNNHRTTDIESNKQIIKVCYDFKELEYLKRLFFSLI